MSKLGLFLVVTLSLSTLLTACGDGGGGSAGSAGSAANGGTAGMAGTAGTGAGGTAGAAGSGGAPSTGDCQTDADCNGGTCAEVTPGGFKVCLSFPPEATMCSPNGPALDACCKSADCMTGKCYLSTSIPYCGGPAMAEYNQCIADTCTDDAGCAANGPAICAPPGAFGQPAHVCLAAFCKTNADCTAKPGGSCAPVNAPCCGTPAGLACVYPDGCRQDMDCATDGSKHCEIDAATKSGVCVDGPAACPA